MDPEVSDCPTAQPYRQSSSVPAVSLSSAVTAAAAADAAAPFSDADDIEFIDAGDDVNEVTVVRSAVPPSTLPVEVAAKSASDNCPGVGEINDQPSNMVRLVTAETDQPRAASPTSSLANRKCILGTRPDADRPMTSERFITEVRRKRKKGTMNMEFSALNDVASQLALTTTVAQLSQNVRKNANQDVVPYDHCRVLLPLRDIRCYRSHDNEPPESDYINASYVDSYTKANAYIAAQGPTSSTLADFWLMIWNENVQRIVMTTSLYEHAKQQCERYWHSRHARYGDIDVWLEHVETNAVLTVRTFKLRRRRRRLKCCTDEAQRSKYLNCDNVVCRCCCHSNEQQPDYRGTQRTDQLPERPRPSEHHQHHQRHGHGGRQRTSIENEFEAETRYVRQFQMSTWDCDDECRIVPVATLLEFRRRVNQDTIRPTSSASGSGQPADSGGPILVHCGDGSGRTCVYIAIDAILNEAANQRIVDAFSCVIYLCTRRQNFIKSLAQYDLIYEVVSLYLRCGDTSIGIVDFPLVVQRLAAAGNNRGGTRRRHHRRHHNGFDRQYKLFKEVIRPLTVGECAGGHRAENRRKSRDIMTQPPERARPYLCTTDNTTSESTDYINAVYVNGYYQTNAHIVTQWPLNETINDIWRLVYDYNIHSIVLLNSELQSKNYPQFWPGEILRETQYGSLTVELLDQDDSPGVVTRCFRIRKPRKFEVVMEDLLKCSRNTVQSGGNASHAQNGNSKDTIRRLWDIGEVMTLISLQRVAANPAADGESNSATSQRYVKMFQLKSWPLTNTSNRRRRHGNVESFALGADRNLERSSAAMTELLVLVREWQRSRSTTAPVCVMSRDGVSRCGVYCAVSISWDKLQSEAQVDVFQAVLTVKPNRPKLVKNKLEYIYCYWFMVVLLKSLHWVWPPGIMPSAGTSLSFAQQHSVDTPDDTDDDAIDSTTPQGLCWSRNCCRSSSRRLTERRLLNELIKQTRCQSADVISALTVLTP